MSKRKDAELQQAKTEALQFKKNYAKHLESGLRDWQIDKKVDDKVHQEHAKRIIAIHLISKRLQEVGRHSTEVRRLLVGLEALEYDVECDNAKEIALLDIANNMEYDSSGSISKSERKIIKSNLKKMKYQDKQAESYKKWMGKQTDENRERVRNYLSDMEDKVSSAVSYVSDNLSGNNYAEIERRGRSSYYIDSAIEKLGIAINTHYSL